MRRGLLAALFAASAWPQTAPDAFQSEKPGGRWYSGLIGPYVAPRVPEIHFDNSGRIYDLIRAGNLYLSRSDAIALAIENNLDVEYERFNSRIAGMDVLRAEGGGTLRGISLTATNPPTGIGGPASPLITAAAATGAVPGSSVPTGLAELNAIQQAANSISITGAAPFSSGPPIPVFDPAVTGSLTWQHSSQPQPTSFATGNSVSSGQTTSGQLQYQQGFSPGTQLGLSFDASRQSSNNHNNALNPYASSSLGVNLLQHLLRGFGPSVNRRFIRIAKNNVKTSDLVFREQAIATISGVILLYDDLVALQADVRVKEETLALAQRLLTDNRSQVEQGTLAPVELTRAQAQVSAAEQDLANSRGYELQQELIVKTVLTKKGTADPRIRTARILTTDDIEPPAQSNEQPTDDLVAAAFRQRPELMQARLQIENSHISLEGSRNELLPELDLVATAQNSGLAGQMNPLAQTNAGSGAAATATTSTGSTPNTGGIGGSLGQTFSFRYPTYSVGVQLELPIRNRVAEADVIRDEYQLRQWQVRYQQLENQVRLEVEGAAIALDQARQAYAAATQTRGLQEQSLKIELEKYGVGLSTTFLVLSYQNMLAQAKSTEVAARDACAKARTQLERVLGSTLDVNGISFETAYRGDVKTPPHPH